MLRYSRTALLCGAGTVMALGFALAAGVRWSHVVANMDWMALAVQTVGTVLWAHNGRGARYAAVWWLLSSLLWIYFAYANGLTALGARDLISVALYLYGGYRWLVEKSNRELPNGVVG